MMSPIDRCKLFISRWKKSFFLNNREQKIFSKKLNKLNNQISRLNQRHFKAHVFGRVGVGKSSLLNALVGKNAFKTDIIHGSTSVNQSIIWDQPINCLHSIELVDTPGIDEIKNDNRIDFNKENWEESDLILFVIDSDITQKEIDALEFLEKNGKSILLILNRSDQWKNDELISIKKSIKNRLPLHMKNISIEVTAAAPYKNKLLPDGTTDTVEVFPQIETLRKNLIDLLNTQGELLLAQNTIIGIQSFDHSLKVERLKRGKHQAQRAIGKFAAIKASSVAINPIMAVDMSAGLACDTALIIELSKLYGMQLRGPAARELLKRITFNNALLIAAQIILTSLRHLLIVVTPITGGLSFLSTGPIALIQAGIAVHTTKKTGILAAKEILKVNQKNLLQPSLLLHKRVIQHSSFSSQTYKFLEFLSSRDKTKEIKNLFP